jgi:uncharacterized membrane protein YbhN (UPF0104 family)
MTNEQPQDDFTQLKDAYSHYEAGKKRRYELLFSINGGAFAIAKLLVDPKNTKQVLGNLTLTHLAIGMILFTIVMVWDICGFGWGMRSAYLKNRVFRWQGITVLCLLGSLIIGGWLLVMLGPKIQTSCT